MPKMKLVIRRKKDGVIIKTFETVYSFNKILEQENDASKNLDREKFYTEIIDCDEVNS